MKIRTHILFWLVVIVFLTLFFGQEGSDYRQSFYFATMLIPVAMGTTYLFLYYLIPQFLLKRRFWSFGLYFFYTLIISIYLEMLMAVGAFIVVANYQFENMNPLTVDILTMGVAIYFIVFIAAFGQLVGRYFTQEEQIRSLDEQKAINSQTTIQIRSDRKLMLIKLEELCFVESLADYVKVHTLDNSYITKEKISKLEAGFPESFIRIHRSFLVNSLHIQSFTKESIMICDQQLPISRTYKANVIKQLMQTKRTT